MSEDDYKRFNELFVEGHHTVLIGRDFYVHSGGFKSVGRLCIGGDCFEIMWRNNGDDLQSPLEATRVSHWRAEHT